MASRADSQRCAHRWQLTQNQLLGLPTPEGMTERYLAWRYALCAEVLEMTGEFRLLMPLASPVPFLVAHTTERAAGGLLAQVAAREERAWSQQRRRQG